MGYKIVANRDEMDMMRVKYGPRKGLEGPFWFVDRVLYYDPIMGQYWDPRTDFYVDNAEVDQLQNRLMAVMRAGV